MKEEFENVSDENFSEIEENQTFDSRPKSTRYQYSYIELEDVISNPDEYIIPECQPACRAAWNKNIETFMVSNYDDENLYVLFANLSFENQEIFKKLIKLDKRFFYSEFRETYGIKVKGNDKKAERELEALVEVLKIQDTKRFQTSEEFLDDYKRTGGKMVIDKDGSIIRLENPKLANVSLLEALKQSRKEGLYIASEDRVYESRLYLEWHKRYIQALRDNLKLRTLELEANSEVSNLGMGN